MTDGVPPDNASNIVRLASSLPSVPLMKRTRLPRKSGVYLVMTDQGTVIYVGSSKDIYRRWRCHNRLEDLKQMECTTIRYYLCDVKELIALERTLILQFNPPLNMNKRLMPKPHLIGDGMHHRFRAWIENNYVSQTQFAKLLHVTNATLSGYVTGQTIPGGDEMIKIANLLPPGAFEWIITGRELSDIETLQQVMWKLSSEDQANVLICADVLASSNTGLIGIIRAVMASAKDTIDVAISLLKPEKLA